MQIIIISFYISHGLVLFIFLSVFSMGTSDVVCTCGYLKYSRSWFPRQPCLPVQELNAVIPWFEPVEANMYPRVIKYLDVRYNIVKVLLHSNGVLPHWYTNSLNVRRNVTIFVWSLLNKDLDVCDFSFCLFELISCSILVD